jgi:murein DD-endopeptidase MepM/ murein hydrolase activator NlpD
VITPQTVGKINEISGRIAAASGGAIVIITDNYLPTGWDYADDYANYLFDKVGIGSAELNNGLLLYFTTNDNRVWLATGGVTSKLFADTSDRDIGIAAAIGITSSTDSVKNLFNPNNTLTREQAAQAEAPAEPDELPDINLSNTYSFKTGGDKTTLLIEIAALENELMNKYMLNETDVENILEATSLIRSVVFDGETLTEARYKLSDGATITLVFNNNGTFSHSNAKGQPLGFNVDFPLAEGTAVYAPTSGNVTIAGWDTSGYGYLIKMQTDNGFDVLMAHNKSIVTIFFQSVTRNGVLIGRLPKPVNGIYRFTHTSATALIKITLLVLLASP